jgi:tetratricopeptide (TPR) repeat protein
MSAYTILSNLSLGYRSIADYGQSLKMFLQAEEMIKREGIQAWNSAFLNKPTMLYAMLGAARETEFKSSARRLFERATKTNNRIGLGHHSMAFAIYHMNRLEFDDALIHAKKALALFRKADDKDDAVSALVHVAVIQLSQGKLKPATAGLRQAEEIYDAIHCEYLKPILMLGTSMLARLAHSDDAKKTLADALRTSRKMGTRETTWQIQREYALYHKERGELHKALAFYKDTLETIKQITETITEEELRLSYLQAACSLHGKCIDREGCQPVLSLIRTGRDGGERLPHMLVGDAPQIAVFFQLPGDAVQAPCAAEIQAVEVDELPVRPVGDLSRSEEELLVRELREEFLEPDFELFRGKNPPHDIGLLQTRREEIEAARLPAERAAGIGQIIIPRPLLDEILESPVPRRMRVIPGEAQAERRIAVLADADRIEELRQKFHVPLDDQVGQRLQIALQLPGERIVERVQLFRELQEPRPAVRPLEGLLLGPAEILHFTPYVLIAEAFGELGADRVPVLETGKGLQKLDEHPVPVHR